MTIFALSSGPGISGVAIIRISGNQTSLVIKSLTGRALPTPRMATIRKINNNKPSDLNTEGIILCCTGPQSYTEAAKDGIVVKE